MKKFCVVFAVLFLSLIAVGCGSAQQVLWNPTSEIGKEVEVKVIQSQTPFNNDIRILIDGDNVITGNGGIDKKTEYNSEYKGKTVKAKMIYDSQTRDQVVELTIDGKLVGEFTFPKKH